MYSPADALGSLRSSSGLGRPSKVPGTVSPDRRPTRRWPIKISMAPMPRCPRALGSKTDSAPLGATFALILRESARIHCQNLDRHHGAFHW